MTESGSPAPAPGNINKRALLATLAASVAINGFAAFAHWYAVSPGGSATLLTVALFAALPYLLGLLLIFVSIVALIPLRSRPLARQTLIACFVYVVVAMLLIEVGTGFRKEALVQLTERATPLITAIRRFEAENHRPPGSLTELTPRYLADIPATGLGAYPRYAYQVAKNAQEWHENPWVLYIDTPVGPQNQDRFIYLPRENYPATESGKPVERLGNWAYIHN